MVRTGKRQLENPRQPPIGPRVAAGECRADAGFGRLHSAASLSGCGGSVGQPENSAQCCQRASSAALRQQPAISTVSRTQLHKLPQNCLTVIIFPAEPKQSAESEMLQSDFPAQTADSSLRGHAASAIPAELRAGASKFNLELAALCSHLLQRSVPGLPFASLKLLRSAQPIGPGLRIRFPVPVKMQNFALGG